MALTASNAIISVQDGAGAVQNIANGGTALVTPGSQVTVALQSTTGVVGWNPRIIALAYPSLHNLELNWHQGMANTWTFVVPEPVAFGTSIYNSLQVVSVVTDGVQSIASATAYIQTTGQMAPGLVRPARLATNAALAAYTYTNGVIQANANGAMATVDGVAPAVGDRILLTLGAAGADNGLYQVTSLGSGGTPFILTRVPDMPHGAVVAEGTTYEIGPAGTAWANSTWKNTVAGAVTVGTTAPAPFPRIQQGSGATGGGTTIALTTLWALSATTSHMYTQDRTAAAATFIGTIVIGAGTGTATITGTTAHTIDWMLVNW